MTTGVAKLQMEYKEMKKKGLLAVIGGSAGPIKKRCFNHWKACFIGPPKTPYENGLYFIEMKFTDNYPTARPDVRMRTQVYHPNINGEDICVNYLNDWKEENNIAGIVHAVFNLLAEPNEGDGFHKQDINKAVEFKNLYAYEGQTYKWDDENWKGYANKYY